MNYYMQACYGIQVIPKGSWICRNCSAQQTDVPCVLCPNRKGAMKKIRSVLNDVLLVQVCLYII